MAEWYKPFSVTAINFPETDSTFDKCYEFLKDGKKKLLIPLLKIKFPDYYAKGKVNAELQEIIDKYQKPYKKGDSPKTVFFNWNVKNDDEDKTKKLLNNHFKGGASEFVIDLLMSVMNFVNANMVTYSASTTEKPVEKKVSAAVERPASAPTPVSVNTEKKKYSEEEIMKKLAQEEAEANAEDELEEELPLDPLLAECIRESKERAIATTDESEIPFR